MKRLAILFLAASAAYAQSDWRRLGGSTFDAGLASPATGPVASVWFSADGGKLYARTVAGSIWETADMERWSAAPAPTQRPTASSVSVRTPEPSRTIAVANGTVYALGSNLFRSMDNGRSWTNLTGFNGRSVIGEGQNDLAVNPRDPDNIAVANAWGVWASHDGGLSWLGLNSGLPNLPVKEIATGTRLKALISGIGFAQLPAGGATWEPIESEPDYASLSQTLGTPVTAFASAGETAYAGGADGRIWVSRDWSLSNKAATWTVSPGVAGGAIERIHVDTAAPNAAWAASAGRSKSILRTINSGQFWDDITGALVDNPAHGIAVSRSSGAIYIATDRGIFTARADLNALGPVSAWRSLGGLPEAVARDVQVAGTRIYAAIDGYGVYSASEPLLSGTVRIVSSADLTERAAAPGSLVSVIGRRIQSARSGDLAFPVLAAEERESQIQVPFEATGSLMSLRLDSMMLMLPLKPVSPAIFLDHDGAPMLVDSGTGLTIDAKATLTPGSRIQILATGLGRTTPNWPTALAAPVDNPPAVSATVQAYLGGRLVEVTRATLAPGYVGLYVVEIELPAILDSGPAELYLSGGGAESNRVRVYLTSER